MVRDRRVARIHWTTMEPAMKDDGQQIWSAVFLGTPIALLVVFMITAVPCLSAQTSTTGSIAGIVTDTSAAVGPGISFTSKNLNQRQLHFLKHRSARSGHQLSINYHKLSCQLFAASDAATTFI